MGLRLQQATVSCAHSMGWGMLAGAHGCWASRQQDWPDRAAAAPASLTSLSSLLSRDCDAASKVLPSQARTALTREGPWWCCFSRPQEAGDFGQILVTSSRSHTKLAARSLACTATGQSHQPVSSESPVRQQHPQQQAKVPYQPANPGARTAPSL